MSEEPVGLGGPSACPGCGGMDLEDGWVDHARTPGVRWVPRQVRGRIFGLVDQAGQALQVRAFRCRRCARLELYTDGQGAPSREERERGVL